MIGRTAPDVLEAALADPDSQDELSRELAHLVAMADRVRAHSHLEVPADDFRAELRARLLAAPGPRSVTLLTRTRDQVEARTAGVRHSLRVAGASGLAAAMIGTTGVAAAAQSALPGDVLYSVKAFTEDARLALASGDVEQGRLHLAFARERLDEIETGQERLTPDQITGTLERLNTQAVAGANELLAAAATAPRSGMLLEELEAFTSNLRARLLEISPQLPLSVRPATDRALEVLRRIDLQVESVLAPCEDCTQPAGMPPRVLLPGDGPAVPTCDCVGPATSGRVEDEVVVPGDVEPDPGPAETPVPASTVTEPTPDDVASEAPDGSLLGEVEDGVSQVVEPLDDVGTLVDDVLDDTGLGEAVDDTATGVDEAVDDTASLLDDTSTGLDDAISDLGSSVDDVSTGLDDLVDPSETEGGLDDLLP